MAIQSPVSTTGTSAANTAQTVSTPTAGPRKVLYVTVQYSAAPTHAGVTVVRNSAAGAGFDATLASSTANAQSVYWEPSTEGILLNGDALDVTAPAGGAGITSSIEIVSQV